MNYTWIESRDNALVKRMARLMSDRKARRTSGELVCEGSKLLAEALRSGRAVSAILMAEAADVSDLLLERAAAQGTRLYRCPEALLSRISDVQTPQGVLFCCERPVETGAEGFARLRGAKRLLILEQLQDPGNLGTILRTADAFALDGVILCDGCVDPTAPKVVRATMGAIFRLPIISATLQDAAAFVKAEGLPLYATALHANSVPLTQVCLNPAAVIIGNEGRGVSAQALDLCDGPIIIPMQGRAESLNASVAAAIVLYEMSK